MCHEKKVKRVKYQLEFVVVLEFSGCVYKSYKRGILACIVMALAF